MKIEKLTPDQIARFPEFIEKWTRIGLSTEPADRPRAEAGIKLAYECAGLQPPARIVWCDSPLSMGLTRAIVNGLGSVDVGPTKKASVGDSVGASVRDSVGASVRASVRDSVGASVRDSVGDSVGDSVRDSVWDSVWDSVGDSVGASVGDSVRASVGDSVRASVGDSVGASVWDSVRASVGASVWDSVGDSVGASVRDSVGASVGASVRDSVRASVGASVRDSVRASVRDSVRDSVGDSVGASVRDSVRASVGASVWDSVGDSVWASVGASVWDSVYGQHEAGWLSWVNYFAEACSLTEQTQKLAGVFEVAQSANWWLPHQKICWVSERHNVLNRNDRGQLHCETGPALSYPDGWSIWAIDGVRVDEQIIMRPESQTIPQISKESNEEVRRIRIDRYGWLKYLQDSGAKVRDQRRNDRDVQDEQLFELQDGSRRFVCCDPSTGRKYALGVPREVSTCEQAQSWMSHGLDRFAIHRS